MARKEKSKRNSKLNRRNIYSDTVKLIFQNLFSLILGQGLFILISTLVLTPFLSRVFHITLSISGYSYVTINNIGLFLLNPATLLMLIVLFIVLGLFLMFEAFYLTTYFTIIENKEKPKLYKVYLLTLYKLIFCIFKGNLKLLPSVWLTLGVINIPLFVFVINRIRIIRFFADAVPNSLFYGLLLVTIIGIIVIFILCKLFLFHYYIVEDKTYKEALTHSRNKQITKPFTTLLYFIGWNIGTGVVVLALYIFVMALTTLFVSGIYDKSLAIAIFISINDSINGYFIIAIFMICTIGNFALFTHLFFHYKLEKNEKVNTKIHTDSIVNNFVSYKKTVIIILSLLVVVNFYFFFNIVRNGSPLDYMNLDMIRVTSHRGFSHDVPENTLPAIEKAMEEQADFIEVDVRVTKDGELVLLHDDNLRRTTGINKKVWNLNYAEIALLDAGSWMNEMYIGTRIPTLREVFESCKGKVFLNLDLKYRNDKEGLEEKVVALIREYEMEWQCVITTTSLTCLKNIKLLNPDIRTGYIAYQIYDGYYENDDIDFFSIKSNLVSKNVVTQAHKNGKEVHVWTVNSRGEMERLKRLGVDNIITDNPAYAKEVLYQAESDQFFITLLKIIME